MHRYQLTIKPPERGTDIHGSGAYLASRGGRDHNGVDLACYPDSIICAIRPGEVTKIGYPYDPNKHPDKAHLRYVQITDPAGYDLRYFYVQPAVQIGQIIETGQGIGTSQQLSGIYRGMTDHVHFEVKKGGKHMDPRNFLTGMAR